VTGCAPDLHPEAETILDRVDLPPTASLSVDGAREALRDLLVTEEPSDDGLTVRDLSIRGPGGDPETSLAIRTYTPPGEGHPVFVYLHGDG
jgi:acetyl esterase